MASWPRDGGLSLSQGASPWEMRCSASRLWMARECLGLDLDPLSHLKTWCARSRCDVRRCHQEASSQVMIKITGTESTVATKIMSRAKITPRS